MGGTKVSGYFFLRAGKDESCDFAKKVPDSRGMPKQVTYC